MNWEAIARQYDADIKVLRTRVAKLEARLERAAHANDEHENQIRQCWPLEDEPYWVRHTRRVRAALEGE